MYWGKKKTKKNGGDEINDTSAPKQPTVKKLITQKLKKEYST